MSHVFALRGDITHLECDAWMLPTDARYDVTRGWLRAQPGLRARIDAVRRPAFARGEELAQALPPEADEPRIVLTAVPLRGFEHPEQLRPALQAFFRLAASEADARVQGRPERRRRAVPLVALPFFGTAGGGGTLLRGPVLEVLLGAAQRAAVDFGVDVAVVFRDAASHALAQRIRQRRRDLWELPDELLAEARRLSAVAASGHLVPFLGSGVSVSAGSPDWAGLLRGIADQLDLEAAVKEEVLAADRDALDQAAALRSFFEQEDRDDTFNELVAEQVDLPRYGLAPALLAQLPAEEAITLNYDTLYERAAQDIDLPRRVIPTGGAADDAASNRWVLKLHGTAELPETIVLTRDDYLGFNEDRAALSSLVKATLITRHLLFVGFGLKDDHFHEILHDVRRAVRDRTGAVPKLGTVVRLIPDRLDDALFGDALDVVALGEGGEPVAVVGRRLEMFLDALLCFTSDSDSYLLTPGFEEVLTADERRVRDAVLKLERELPEGAKRTAGWSVLERAIARLRSEPFEPVRSSGSDEWADEGPWAAVLARPRAAASRLDASAMPDQPGVYAWFRDQRCVYLGIAGSLRRRIATHLATTRDLSRSTFRASVAVQELGVSRSLARSRPAALDEAQVVRVNAWIAGCEVAWITTPTREAAMRLEHELLQSKRPTLNMR